VAAPSGVIPRHRGVPDGAPGRLRAFRPDDIPAVAALRQRVFRFSERTDLDALTAYCERVFCRHPWPDEELPSLIYEDDRGRPVGFLGVIPRPMWFGDERIRAAVATQLMVAPESRGLAGRWLARAFFLGPQDLSLSDTANDAARRLWESVGGSIAPVHSLGWIRVLRPGRWAASQIARRGLPRRALLQAARPVLAAVDALATHLPAFSPAPPEPDGTTEPITPAAIATHAAEILRGHDLRPDYDECGATAWLLGMAAEKRQFGPLEGALVRAPDGEALGWFLYYGRPGAAAEVLEVAARRPARALVLAHLLRHAWRADATAVTGRLEPNLLRELAAQRCALKLDGPWLLYHSPRPEIMRAVERGDALLSRLDGEWWLSF
jgi:hypothetical protein